MQLSFRPGPDRVPRELSQRFHDGLFTKQKRPRPVIVSADGTLVLGGRFALVMRM